MSESPIHDQVEEAREAVELELTCQMPKQPTVGLDTDEFSELLKLGQLGRFTKQERDFAFAAQLLRGKHIGERRLRHALRGWTTFGDLSLQDFLHQKNILSAEELSQVESVSTRHLQSLESHDSWKDWSPTIAGRTSWLLDRMDPSGRVAKVFGLSRIPKANIGNESRTFQIRFRLIRKLGQGGLGTVWLAVDTSLNRYVAIKEIIAEGNQRPADIGRFRREAEITGRLDHPNIVPIHLLGENESNGRVFYVMRFLGNQTLEDAIREYHERRELGQEDPLAFHRLLTAFVSVCQAVAYAHSRKVIHRDLKPQNVALDDFGQVILLDWGLAKTLGQEDPLTHLQQHEEWQTPENLDVTLAGQVLGTPLYMAPEQAAGRIDEIDELTDGYGLGGILFAILTGSAPHELSNDSLGAGSQLSALLDVIVDQSPPSPRQLNPAISPALEAICLKALSKDRYARYPSALALSEDLQRWMADEPISALQETSSKRIRRWIGKHPRLTQVLSVMAMVFSIILVLGCISSYEKILAAEQLRTQTAIEESRELKGVLALEFQTLANDVQFMSNLPPIQGIIDARAMRNTLPEDAWKDQLRSIYKGLLEVNPGYTAVTCWVSKPTSDGKPIRAENPGMQRGKLKTDLTAFFARHLPAISELSLGDVYIGIPGRFMGEESATTDAGQQALESHAEQVGLCLMAGAGVYDHTTDEKCGGVAIECDLESILRNHLEKVPNHIQEIFLTNSRGVPALQYRRGKGLRPIQEPLPPIANDSKLQAYFADPDAVDIYAVSTTYYATKVPFSRLDSDDYVGLLIRFRE
ncbi:protein kinase [bacterium]|nr:protein kinase [bacterium]